jgi:hypothetical protein
MLLLESFYRRIPINELDLLEMLEGLSFSSTFSMLSGIPFSGQSRRHQSLHNTHNHERQRRLQTTGSMAMD